MSDLPSSDPGAAAAAAPRGDFGFRKPLVFGEVVQLDATKDTTSLRAKELRRGGDALRADGCGSARRRALRWKVVAGGWLFR